MILTAFLIVSLCVVVPFLYYYARRNPHPHFRPKLGEMVLVSIFAVGFAVGGSIFMATILGVNPDFEKMGEAGNRSMTPQRAPSSGGSDAPVDGGGSGDSADGFELPFLRD